MPNPRAVLRTLPRVVGLLTISVILSLPLVGQTYDLQIMVSGSWAYVVDPHPEADPNQNAQKKNRVAVVAPMISDHIASIFHDGDVRTFRRHSPIAKGLYYLDIDRSTPGKGARPSADLLPKAYLFPVVSQKRIAAIFAHSPPMPRIVISLPAPDYYTTYSGTNGGGPGGAGTSESKVGVATTAPTEYTTWMVLHYLTTGAANVHVSNSTDDGALPPVSPFVLDKNSPSFNVVIGAGHDGDLACDLMSYWSFRQSKKLWGVSGIYARFPEPSDQVGGQNRGNYHSWCPLAGALYGVMKKFDSAQAGYMKAVGAVDRLKVDLQAVDNSNGNHAHSVTAGKSSKDISLVSGSLLDLALGHVPSNLESEWTCLTEILRSERPASCPGHKKPTEEAVQRYFADVTNQIKTTAVGGADCHMSQLNINSVVQ
jgi:hypothetical protein